MLRATPGLATATESGQEEQTHHESQCELCPEPQLAIASASQVTQPARPGAQPTQSPNDTRTYRLTQLSNGMRVLLVHDPALQLGGVGTAQMEHEGADCDVANCNAEAAADPDLEVNAEAEAEAKATAVVDADAKAEDVDVNEAEDEDEDEDEDSDSDSDSDSEDRGGNAAVCLRVGVGSYRDPKNAQGNAHFLEHMLFMGSDEFPEDNALEAYLAGHGGDCNAVTEMEGTSFHFDVEPTHLEGALRRFGAMFRCPTFREDLMERESNTGLRVEETGFLAALAEIQPCYDIRFCFIPLPHRAAPSKSQLAKGVNPCEYKTRSQVDGNRR